MARSSTSKASSASRASTRTRTKRPGIDVALEREAILVGCRADQHLHDLLLGLHRRLIQLSVSLDHGVHDRGVVLACLDLLQCPQHTQDDPLRGVEEDVNGLHRIHGRQKRLVRVSHQVPRVDQSASDLSGNGSADRRVLVVELGPGKTGASTQHRRYRCVALGQSPVKVLPTHCVRLDRDLDALEVRLLEGRVCDSRPHKGHRLIACRLVLLLFDDEQDVPRVHDVRRREQLLLENAPDASPNLDGLGRAGRAGEVHERLNRSNDRL
jgi:hypothetical protein